MTYEILRTVGKHEESFGISESRPALQKWADKLNNIEVGCTWIVRRLKAVDLIKLQRELDILKRYHNSYGDDRHTLQDLNYLKLRVKNK